MKFTRETVFIPKYCRIYPEKKDTEGEEKQEESDREEAAQEGTFILVENPIRVTIRTLGTLDFREWSCRLVDAGTAARVAGAKLVDTGPAINALYKDLVARCVVKIENLEVDGMAITTGAALYDAGLPLSLIDEIEAACREAHVITEAERKN